MMKLMLPLAIPVTLLLPQALALTLPRAVTTTKLPTVLAASPGISASDLPLSNSAPTPPGFDLQSYLDKAAREDALFKTDPSVFFWRYLESQGEHADQRLLSNFFTTVLTSASPTQRAVWMTFVARTAFFGTNAAVANLLADQRGASIMASDLNFSFLLYELVKSYEQELKFIEDGRLKYPWDYIVQRPTTFQPIRIQWRHRQSNPVFALQESMRLLQEMPAILERFSKFHGKPSGTVPVQLLGNAQYPRYYLNDFHYQTDGWLSAESAKRYEMSTETIFVGTQDVMQRQTILPLLSKYRSGAAGDKRAQDGPGTILEVACGTGRFSTFVRDNFPAASVTLTDLSPFYLEKAMENDRYWREFRGRDATHESTGFLTAPAPAQIIQCNAEDLPFLDKSFHTVLCVYLFHELPKPARIKAAKEMARVVKPGGIVVLSDSIQIGDRKAYGKSLDNFSKLNEPHYIGYQRDDLPALFTSCGLECHEKYVNSRTKTLSFIKPHSPSE